MPLTAAMMVHSAALLSGASVRRAWPSQSSHPGKEDDEPYLVSDISHTRQTPTGCLQWASVREAEKLLAAWNSAPAAFKMGLGEQVRGPDSWLMHTNT